MVGSNHGGPRFTNEINHPATGISLHIQPHHVVLEKPGSAGSERWGFSFNNLARGVQRGNLLAILFLSGIPLDSFIRHHSVLSRALENGLRHRVSWELNLGIFRLAGIATREKIASQGL